jgi:hypothetical protein
MVIDRTATVTCFFQGKYLETYSFKFPGTLDDSNEEQPSDMKIGEDARKRLVDDGKISPIDRHNPGVKFDIVWSREPA